MRRDLDIGREARHAERTKNFGDPEVLIGNEVFTLNVNAPYGVWIMLEEAGETEGIGVFRKTEEAILMLINPDEDGSYTRLRAVLRKNFTHDDLLALMRDLTEEASGRPTEAPGSSQPGREQTGTSSTDTSSSTPGEAQAI